jgi:transcription initiation factor TFIIIB Brf1 subunit/transcription initiation factor TFIIB
MARWECAIEGDDAAFDRVEDLIVHQATEHDRIECMVCGAVVPDGYFAIRHAFEEHSRAEYVRAYGASSEEVREREEIKELVEEEADLQAVVERLGGEAVQS